MRRIPMSQPGARSTFAVTTADLTLIGLPATDQRTRSCVNGGAVLNCCAACEAIDTGRALVIIGKAEQDWWMIESL